MAWLYLVIAGFFEMGFATSLKMMDNHKNIPWTLSFYICILASFLFLNLAI
jgi:quaternary ammonium compound-resistance protein SugE